MGRKKAESALAPVESQQEFVQVIESSGADISKGKLYALHFSENMELVNELTSMAKEQVDFDNPTEEHAKLARAIRLKLVPNRTNAERKKDMLKKNLLVETNLIQSLFNVIKNSSEMVEEMLLDVEKRKEREEKERLDKLREERMALISQYTETSFPVEHMSQEAFDSLLQAQKDAFEKAEVERIAEEQRIEAERIERERVQAVERTLLPYSMHIENFDQLDIASLTEEQVSAIINQAKVEIEAERISREAAEKAEAEAKAAVEEAKKKQQEAERKLREAEQAERERERIRQQEAAAEEARIAQEKEQERMRIEAAARMSDKDKIIAFATDIMSVSAPVVDSKFGKQLVQNIESLRLKIFEYALAQTQKMQS